MSAMRKSDKGARKAVPPENGAKLGVRVDANFCRSLTLRMHDAILNPALPVILDHLVKCAARGAVMVAVTCPPTRDLSALDRSQVLMTLRPTLEALGFTVRPGQVEVGRLGRSEIEPALEVSWL